MIRRHHPTRVASVAAPVFANLLDKKGNDSPEEVIEHAQTALARAVTLLDEAHAETV